MRFGLLGPLEVGGDSAPTAVAAPKQRTILACLALRPNQVVACETLIDALWPRTKPANARMTLLNYVARLRRTLGPAAERVQTGHGGYRLVIREDSELDHLHAAGLETAARRAVEAGDWQQGQATAETALALWRGEPFEDVPCEILHADYAGAFEALWLRLEELRIDALLGAGRFEGALPHLSRLISARPLHEPLYERRLIAFYGAGRRADALESHRTLRAVLRDSLGADSSARMGELHHLVLADAPISTLTRVWREAFLGTATADSPETAPDSPVPNARSADSAPQLPRRPRLLVGRDRELKELTRLLAERLESSGSPYEGSYERSDDSDGDEADCRVAVLTGPAGVGKTSVALAWAHSVSDRFPTAGTTSTSTASPPPARRCPAATRSPRCWTSSAFPPRASRPPPKAAWHATGPSPPIAGY